MNQICIGRIDNMAQLGNSNAKKGAKWRGAVSRALKRYEDDEVKQGKALNKIAEKVVRMALAGDTFAIKEIGDRLDGKAQQSIVGADNQPISLIERVIVVQQDNSKVIEGETVNEAIETTRDNQTD